MGDNLNWLWGLCSLFVGVLAKRISSSDLYAVFSKVILILMFLFLIINLFGKKKKSICF